MKKFIINILIFFGMVAVVDVAAGKVFWYLQSTKAGGGTGSEYYVCKKSNEDVLIMGSSRALHHYDPDIITDSLALSCYNAGQSGNGIIMQYGRWKMISERYKPKVLIYDITYYFDLMENDNMTYIDRLKPYCEESLIKNYLTGLYPLERLKLFSDMYRYNYKFMEIISDCIMSQENNKGYEPLYGTIREDVMKRSMNNIKTTDKLNYDSQKLRLIEQLAVECKEKGTKLIFVVSPSFFDSNNSIDTYRPIKEIAARNNVPCYLFVNTSISRQKTCFKDTQHLNKHGAEVFTQELIRSIKNDMVM